MVYVIHMKNNCGAYFYIKMRQVLYETSSHHNASYIKN